MINPSQSLSPSQPLRPVGALWIRMFRRSPSHASQFASFARVRCLIRLVLCVTGEDSQAAASPVTRECHTTPKLSAGARTHFSAYERDARACCSLAPQLHLRRKPLVITSPTAPSLYHCELRRRSWTNPPFSDDSITDHPLLSRCSCGRAAPDGCFVIPTCRTLPPSA